MTNINSSLHASQIAQNAFKKGEQALTQYTDNINASLKQANELSKTEALPPAQFNLDNYMKAPVPSIEDSVLGVHMTEKHMLSLLKVIEAEKNTFDQSMGKIFDGWA